MMHTCRLPAVIESSSGNAVTTKIAVENVKASKTTDILGPTRGLWKII